MGSRKSQSGLYEGILLLCITMLLNVLDAQTGTDPTSTAAMTESTTLNGTMQTTTWNPSMTGQTLTSVTPYNITCKSFSCTNDSCYKTEATNQTCTTSYYCELFRYTLTNYTAGCSMTCRWAANICRNSSMTNCTQECCNTQNCLKLDGTVQALTSTDGAMTTMAMTTVASTTTTKTTTPTTTTTTTTTTTPTTTKSPTTVPTTAAATTSVSYNGKICKSFTCNGTTCYQGKTTTEKCRTGYDYCELREKFLSGSVLFIAGCSPDCDEDKNVCTSTSTKDCLMECCTATTDCLRLDGKPHMMSNTSPAVTILFVQILSCSLFTLLCNMYGTSFLHM